MPDHAQPRTLEQMAEVSEQIPAAEFMSAFKGATESGDLFDTVDLFPVIRNWVDLSHCDIAKGFEMCVDCALAFAKKGQPFVEILFLAGTLIHASSRENSGINPEVRQLLPQDLTAKIDSVVEACKERVFAQETAEAEANLWYHFGRNAMRAKEAISANVGRDGGEQ